MGGFGKEAQDGQRRFISKTTEEYLELFEASKQACESYSGANIGIGIHSMRGVKSSDIVKIANEGPQDVPFHIHISEQLKEIEDCLNYLGKRPVEWLSQNIQLSERFHLVHATHLSPEEISMIASTKANVVLCPTTEGNLGDGLFPFNQFQKEGGQWSIGTDSHIGINPLEELRLLDYGQRLISHKRNTFAQKTGDSGAYAIEMATVAGRKAMNNFEATYFKVGEKLNAAIIDSKSPLLALTRKERLTSSLLYTSDSSHIWGAIINGSIQAANGKHKNEETIKANFVKAINEIGNRS
jgi:formiminoglutamate deiminase